MSNLTRKNPQGLHPPVGRCSHVIGVSSEARRVVISGQVGVRPDGSVVEDLNEQVAQVAENIKILSTSEGLGPADVVKVTTFLTDRDAIPIWRTHRDALFGQHDPASTLVFVAGLADPRFKIEVELEAAG